MHASSMANMLRCIRKYIDPLPASRKLRVVDLGSANVNGSYRELFDASRFDYIGVDLAPGPGVDLVIPDPYRIPLPDGSADIVISGQMLEHNEFFWLTFQEKTRLVHNDGFIFMIAPSRGQIHRFPVDCYRFYPDAYAALAKHTNTVLVDCWLDENHWGDLVGVFRKSFSKQYGKFDTSALTTWRPVPPLEALPGPTAGAPWNGKPATPEEERLAGSMPYTDVLARIHRTLDPAFYLEIGVRTGASLALAVGDAIGIDPAPMISVTLPPSTTVVTTTSDDFFASRGCDRPIDFAFIDGLHLFEQALRDFIHVEALAGPSCVVAIDDIFPNHAHQAARERRTRAWTGDVWKLHEVLRRHRPDLTLLPLNTYPTGCLIVTGLDPANRALPDAYDALVAEYTREMAPPAHVLARIDGVPPDGVVFKAVLEHQARATAGSHARVTSG